MFSQCLCKHLQNIRMLLDNNIIANIIKTFFGSYTDHFTPICQRCPTSMYYLSIEETMPKPFGLLTN